MDRGTLRRLLTPGWFVLHVIAVAAFAALVGLGRWQWERGSDLGRVQNYSYALEWWLFAGFAVFLWVKTMADTLEDRDDADDDVAPFPAPEPATAAVVDDDEDDPELAAYNRRLRELHAKSQEQP